MSKEKEYTFGMIGLGTMGCNLLLNMADHGFAVAGYDKDEKKVARFSGGFHASETELSRSMLPDPGSGVRWVRGRE